MQENRALMEYLRIFNGLSPHVIIERNQDPDTQSYHNAVAKWFSFEYPGAVINKPLK